MKVFKEIEPLRFHLMEMRQKGLKIGFVPTMGALHMGHASLILRAKQENDISICSIFINPIQFNNETDLKNYPNNLENDRAFLESLECDILFAPSKAEIYPEVPRAKYDFGALETVLEGKYRPDHFNGVATVVKRLFEIVEPEKAYFGMKDYQQLVIIKELVRQLDLNVTIVPCETMREKNGLAMSSRNELLSKEERQSASKIYQGLTWVKNNRHKLSVPVLKQRLISDLETVKGLQVEYVEVSDPENLEAIHSLQKNKTYLLSLAVYLGKVRLIDNVLF